MFKIIDISNNSQVCGSYSQVFNTLVILKNATKFPGKQLRWAPVFSQPRSYYLGWLKTVTHHNFLDSFWILNGSVKYVCVRVKLFYRDPAAAKILNFCKQCYGTFYCKQSFWFSINFYCRTLFYKQSFLMVVINIVK